MEVRLRVIAFLGCIPFLGCLAPSQPDAGLPAIMVAGWDFSS